VKVLFINQFFHPDIAATAQLLTDLAEDLTSAGISVTVVTGRAAYSDGRSLGPPVEVYQGIRIYRVGGVPLQRRSIWARYLSYLIFWVAATVRCLLLPRHDIVVPLTTPPLLSCLGIVLRWVKGSRVVCWSMDVYPELGVLLGAIREGTFATRAFGVLSAWSLRGADGVVPLGSHMARHLVAKGVPADRIRILPTWEDPNLVVPIPRESNPFRDEHELDGRFVVLYSGNLGAAHEFGTLLDAAGHLASEPGIVFLFAGGGPRKRWVEEQAQSRGLQNVRFLPYQPREGLRFSLSSGDVHVVTLRPGFEGLLVPSKFVGALAAGRPILFVGPTAGEIPDALTAGDCGVTVAPGDWRTLANTILEMRANADLWTRMGRNARALFERQYSRERVTAAFRAVLEEVGPKFRSLRT
jgi:colanic acid biosynthesis glycosyl transferase WcaI